MKIENLKIVTKKARPESWANISYTGTCYYSDALTRCPIFNNYILFLLNCQPKYTN